MLAVVIISIIIPVIINMAEQEAEDNGNHWQRCAVSNLCAGENPPLLFISYTAQWAAGIICLVDKLFYEALIQRANGVWPPAFDLKNIKRKALCVCNIMVSFSI